MSAATAPVEAAASVPTRPMTGIIYPPPGIRDIIDMTAGYVVDKGPKFMELVCKNEANNPKFNFLQDTDPYHAYFEYMLEEKRTGGAAQKKEAKEKEVQERRDADDARRREIEEQAMRRTRALRNAGKTLAQIEWSERRKPTSPPEDLQFLCPAPSAYAQTLDVIKLTARFAAGKGKEFRQQIQRREQANPMFDFLKPQHSMFTYFGKLVEQYTLILLAQEKTAVLERLAADTGPAGTTNILERVLARSHFAQRKREMEEKEKENEEKERREYQQIDWYDFAVVGTLEFAEDEAGEFPPPVTKAEIGGRVIAQERAKNAPKPVPTTGTNITAMQDADDDMDMSDDDDAPPPPSTAKVDPAAPVEEEVIIKDFDPKAKAAEAAAKANKEVMLISPWTNEPIPASEMERHSAIVTLDPRWAENNNKAKAEKNNTSQLYAQNAVQNLSNFAKVRQDIFGSDGSTAKGNATQNDGAGVATSARQRLAQGQTNKDEQLKVLQTMHGDLGLGQGTPQNVQAAVPPRVGTSVASAGAGAGPTPLATTKRAALPPLSQVMPASAQQRRFGPNPTGPSRPNAPPAAGAGRANPSAMPPPQRLGNPNLPPPTRLGGSGGPPPRMGNIPPSSGAPVGMPMSAAPPASSAPGLKRPMPHETSNDAKRPKQQDATAALIDENEFLAANPGPVSVEVVVPKEANSNWSFNGQTLNFTFAMSASVADIKSKITEAISIPGNKQKLKESNLGFLKDNFTLAKYNLKSGVALELSAKTRGGKK